MRVRSPELELAIECCRRSFRGAGDGPVEEVADSIRWPRFLDLVRFHRVEGLVWRGLAEARLPSDVRDTLAQAASAIAADSLRARFHSLRLLQAFEREGVPVLFLKGITLASLAYRDPSLKAAIDIDLLVDRADLGRASGVLRGDGYRLVAPRESPDDRVLHAWHRNWKESVWVGALQLDLHTRTADNPWLIPGIDVHSPSRRVDVGDGILLPTLSEEELFAYLAVHGASTSWFRLKWVADVGGLLQGKSPQSVEALYYRSQLLGAGRAAGQALLLADHLFGTLRDNSQLSQQLEGDRPTRRLVRSALRYLTGEPAEPTERLWGTFAIHRDQFSLLPGLSYKVGELRRQAGRIAWRFR